ncbi:hypothetical protein ACJMK2_023573 [Sinanodonta woodiana]|uniref:Uncharacterized protein n=1 Tax=Sinanodonta woodiana TaxID=1069815 RepID=A0ABD3T4N2_SINWO
MSLFEPLIVAAIDIGTTYSTYAFSTRKEFESDPVKIYAKTNWVSSDNFVGEKTTTAVLFDEQKDFHKFGFEAEDFYTNMGVKEIEKWYFFSRFKMNLFKRKKYQENMQLQDIRGKKMPAIDVFSAAIAYLKNHLIKKVRDELPDIRMSDFLWVITVPAIWEDGARQFMRKAAIKAHFWEDSGKGDGSMRFNHEAFAQEAEIQETLSRQIMLALEPEAAALYCRCLQLQLIRSGDGGASIAPFSPGQHFLLVDLGGGTSDMIAYEMLESGDLRELTEPNGGDGGGVIVDEAFWSLLRKHYGDGVIDEFKTNKSSDYLEMQRQFELKKRNISKSSNEVTRMKLRSSLAKIYKEKRGLKLKDNMIISEHGVSFNKDKLELSHDVSLGLFEEPKKKLLIFLEKRYLLDVDRYSLDAIVMVGGFSESEVIKEEVKAAFENKNIKVIVPKEASLAVVKGAVLYGHNHMAIRERVLPYTYGISLRVKFDEAIHPIEKKIWCDNRQIYIAEDVFQSFIQAGTRVITSETCVEHTHTAFYFGTNKATIEVYRSKEPNPKFVTDEGCSKVGKLELEIPNLKELGSKLIDIKMYFGNTELTVEAKELDSDNRIKSAFNFLI